MVESNAVTIAGFGRFEAKEHRGRRVVGLDGEEYDLESRRCLRSIPTHL